MSLKEREEKRKKQKKRGNIGRLFLVSFIFIYLFFRSIPSLFGVTSKSIFPESTIIEDKIETKGIIIKKENVYYADGNGTLELYVDEGERVPSGIKIAQLSMLDETSTLKQELNELNKKIDILTKTEKDNEIIKIDENKVQEGLDETIRAIQNSIADKNYEKVEVLKGKLSLYYGKQREISGEDTLISYSVESLEKSRDELLQQITSNTIDYYSKQSGIVSYIIDEFEDIYSFNNKEKYTYSDFKEASNKQNSNEKPKDVEYGKPIFKIIDNLEWYMIIKIDNMKDVSNYEVGKYITITSDKNNKEIKGIIKNINKDGNKGTILCKFNTDFYDYYDKRFIDVSIIKYKHEAYKLPIKCVVEKDGIKGVYTKDISGIIKFKPIEILAEDDKFVYVSNGDKNNKIKLKGSDKLVKTISIFDEILLNTKNVKDGSIIE
ncbi:putative membrane fusion protein [Keratinibaculum paraultunense]|uniref:Putative membrane fusion protein n=1 Tax=Keratinibaculum paraultunense TaxID=1278232 RepID=A0A4R3KYF4_9FIRM|nr:HlyD family efflux transporter periplasmic adaptor subunit [Keratinibaculum paraultunense]QQY78739.1 hypothetical protein JL105_05795 [Keratinibaculum paraultunense]TCS89582.1 putative membrane fusion protein [Keratinibaculum paraultunense]